MGQLTQDHQEKLQDRLFVDPGFSNQFLIIENELIEDYALGNLTFQQTRLFEQYFLRSPDRLRRVKVAQQLKDYARSMQKEPSFAGHMLPRFSWKWMALNPRIVVAVTILVLSALLLWLLRDRGILQIQIRELQARQDSQQQQQERLREDMQNITEGQAENLALKQQIQDEQQRANQLEARIKLLEKQLDSRSQLIARPGKGPNDRQQQPLADLQPQQLWPGQGRNTGGPNLVRIPTGARQVLLHLMLDEDKYSSYRVELKGANNRTILIRSGLKAQQTPNGELLMVSLPARVLAANDYIVTVRGIDIGGKFRRVDSYQFRALVE